LEIERIDSMETTNRLSRLSTSNFLELYSLNYIINKDSEVYGKEILDNIKMHNLQWNPSHGSFYPVINSMVKDGLIQCVYEYDSKKYYNITSYGREYFNDRVTQFRDTLVKTSQFYSEIVKTLPD
jgi:DNA-binding PadR family transcriptional regulator